MLMVHFYAATQVWPQHGPASPDVQPLQVLQSYWIFWFILASSCSLEWGPGCLPAGAEGCWRGSAWAQEGGGGTGSDGLQC